MRQREVLKYLLDLDHYATWTETLLYYGLDRSQETERTLRRMLDRGWIIKDGDHIIVTAVTNAKHRKLIRESISISDIPSLQRSEESAEVEGGMTEEAWNAWGENHHLKRASTLINQALFRTDTKDLDLKVTLIRQSVEQIIRHLAEAEGCRTLGESET